jgi:hypothetical protein
MDFAMSEWMKQRDVLIEETMAFVQGVAADAPKTADSPKSVVPLVQSHVVGAIPSPKNRVDMERAMIQRRVADFAARQQKFQQEREEYYERTMKAARATQWAAPRQLAMDGAHDEERPMSSADGARSGNDDYR